MEDPRNKIVVADDTRVGHGATSVLEKELLEYIRAHTVNGVYIGETRYLENYGMLTEYNSRVERTTSNSRDTILCADDDPFVRKVFGEVVVKRLPQFQFEFFEDGTSLVTRLNIGVPKGGVVITDHDMPGINGSEIIRRYATKPEFSQTPFILHYGGDESIGMQAVRDGAFAYLLKPLGIAELPGVIRRALLKYS